MNTEGRLCGITERRSVITSEGEGPQKVPLCRHPDLGPPAWEKIKSVKPQSVLPSYGSPHKLTHNHLSLKSREGDRQLTSFPPCL